MRKSALLLPLLLLTLWPAAGNSPAQAQSGGLTIAEKFTPGLRRSATISRTFKDVFEYPVAGEVVSRTTTDFTTTALVHEWYRALDESGRPRQYTRSYQKLKQNMKSDSWNKFVEINLKTENDITPAWAGQVLNLEVSGGELKITGGDRTLVTDQAKAGVIQDFETDILPRKERKVGESWKVRGASVENLRDSQPSLIPELGLTEGFEDGLLTVTLAALNENVATLEIKGTIKHRKKKVVEYLPEPEVTNVLYEAEVTGSAQFDTGLGRWVSRSLAADIKYSGKLGGQAVQGTGTLRDERTYHYGYILDEPPKPDTVEGSGLKQFKVFAAGAIDPAMIVLGVNSNDRAALVEFDPATGRIARTLLALPAGKSIDHASLSPDRKRVAFASTLNSEISIAPWNIFVLELETGALNQLTPEWATNEGVAQAKSSAKTGTITGRVEWPDGQTGTSRSDYFSGSVRVDQTSLEVMIGQDGGFSIKDVPAGPVVLRVKGRVTARRTDGRDDGRTTADWGAVTVALAVENETSNTGNIRLSNPAQDMVFANPTWQAERVSGHLWTTSWVYDVGYPKRSYSLMTKDTVPGQAGALGYSPDGKMLAINAGLGSSAKTYFLDATTRLVLRSNDPAALGIEYGAITRGTWTTDCKTWASAGYGRCRYSFSADMPLVYVVKAADGATMIACEWPEFSGRQIIDITPSTSGDSVFLVIRQPAQDGLDPFTDLYQYTPATDTLRRLTGLKDVQTVSNFGR
ncbi:MAG: hypothetical protein IPP14_06540 [Planctomycetes bacterium]|nr:hypothetical protein [Planctomycetota bacterium]